MNATSPNWDALILNDYETVFPLPIKSKFGFTYLSQPPFTSQLGAFGKLNLDIEFLFFNYIISHYKLIDLELNNYDEEFTMDIGIWKSLFEEKIKSSFEDEVADVAIRLFDLCGGMNIDLEKHIELKMKYNSLRGYKHGKAF